MGSALDLTMLGALHLIMRRSDMRRRPETPPSWFPPAVVIAVTGVGALLAWLFATSTG